MRIKSFTPISLFLILLVVFSVLLLIYGKTFWDSIGVPAGEYLFGDFNVVKNAYKLHSLGLNLYDQKYLIDTTIYNYPKIWIYISKFLNLENILNSIFFIVFMIISYTYVYLYMIKKTGSYIPILLFFSGSSMLLIERGNVDLLIFFMVFLVSLNRNIISKLFYIVASFLKVYPALLFPFFMKDKRLINGLLFAPVLIYFFLIKDELLLISNSTPMSSGTSYGTLTLSIIIERYLDLKMNHFIISILFMITSFFFFFIVKRKIKMKDSNSVSNYKNMFICGGIIYLSTFLAASNWDYRLVFLVLCYPLLSLQPKIISILFLTLYLFASHFTILYKYFWIYGSLLNQISKTLLFFLVSFYMINIYYKSFFQFTYDKLKLFKK